MAIQGLRVNGAVAPGDQPGIILNTDHQSAYVFENSNKPAVAYNPGVGDHINTGVEYADYTKVITASESNKFSFFRFTSEYRTVDKLLAKALGMTESQISGFFGKTLWGKGKVRSFLCDLVYKYHLPPAAAREVFNVLVANKGDYKKLVKGLASDPRNPDSQRVVGELAACLGRCRVDLSELAASAANSDSYGVKLLGAACGQVPVAEGGRRGAAASLPLPSIGEDALLDGLHLQVQGALQTARDLGRQIEQQDAEWRRAQEDAARRSATTSPSPPSIMGMSTRPPTAPDQVSRRGVEDQRPSASHSTRRDRLTRLGEASSALQGEATDYSASTRTLLVNTILGDYAERLRALNGQIAGGDLADVVAKAVEDKRLHKHKRKSFTEALEGAIGTLREQTAQQIVDGMLSNPAKKWNKGSLGGFFRSFVE